MLSHENNAVIRDGTVVSHRLVTEPLAALPPLSPPFSAAVVEGVAAAGSMFWEAMCAEDSVDSGYSAAAGMTIQC